MNVDCRRVSRSAIKSYKELAIRLIQYAYLFAFGELDAKASKLDFGGLLKEMSYQVIATALDLAAGDGHNYDCDALFTPPPMTLETNTRTRVLEGVRMMVYPVKHVLCHAKKMSFC